MDKQKQIEEIQAILPNIEVIKAMCGDFDFAKLLYDRDVRKIPENAVVLTKEEHKSLIYWKGKFDELIKLVTETTRKETAEKFAERLKAQYPPRTDERCTLDDCYMLDKIDEIAKEIMEGK